MFVSFTSSDYYSPHTGVAIYSLLDNNRDSEKIEIFLLDLGISEENKDKLLSIVESFAADGLVRTLTFVPITEEKIKAFLSESIPVFLGSFATYARLCVAKLYPEYVDRLFVLDSDIIVKGSLKKLYESDLTGKLVAATPVIGDPTEDIEENKEEYKIRTKHKYYINAGFMLLNVAFWREIGFDDILNECAKTMKDFMVFDQSILNNALEDKWLIHLPYKYNYSYHKVPDYLFKFFLKKQSKNLKAEIAAGHDDPIIVHFPGDVLRPWFKENISSMSRFYDEYKEKTPFKDVPKESIFDRPKYKNASFLARLFLRIQYKTHRSIIGYPFYVLNELRMNINKKKIKKGKSQQ